MGVASSKFQRKRKLQMIDFGSITPLGLYEKNNDDYDLQVVRELILSKKLSPFYKGLSDPLTQDCNVITEKLPVVPPKKRPSLYRKPKSRGQDYKMYLSKNEKRLYSILYNDSIECPICFLYYPANINFARCCDQPICTECFVQIKKRPADASASTSVVRDSGIVCPYCMTDNFGVIYHCPPSTPTIHLEKVYKMRSTTSGLSQHQQPKRKSIESDHPNVVLIDHVRMKPSDAVSSKSDMRASSLHFWFQSSRSSNVTSLDRYLSTIRLEDMSIHDIVALESMRQSLLEKENRNHNHRLYQSYIF
ncbi:hypothetical protein V8B55DRAFT_1454034 [Mucor lusitanicus]|uniref:RING-type domain-containing protein n=2 Tax=Mucor circinelloides f. lusitanicus TaxID=29924 RepID=A0A168JYN1_MUCCL|nr:hypothetical protein FB192DRAFT_1348937 [Mucor lusitanicus]OAD01774.1 hypothetical protein MUCCIDRAFT_156358 [Mucor lusitanicus CBS 277.49]